ncbi:hypothetical protein AAFF_G00323440 [Aldrovandia affinis]|uniref:Uncharacterized protein n=1 Tax=Aldrovandia affinis TaxID=143900 RepID=A0AAD7W0P3_9TELE|nr:hypothetical protein AAFF_G00323440 [Aldrovandia affinis]
MPRTLNELAQLRDSEFGWPHPRHGLRLLYWLAYDCIRFDYRNMMTLQCNPHQGDYGFHYFENREEDLPFPIDHYSYYEVGNLQLKKANELPPYIRENYTRGLADSNSDRIILSLGPGNMIDRIYVTEHEGLGRFDSERTYRISKGLIKLIGSLDLQYFLSQVGEPDISYPTPDCRQLKVINMEAPQLQITIPTASQK